MSGHVGLFDYLDKVKAVYGEDCTIDASLEDLRIDLEEFFYFCVDEFELSNEDRDLLKSSLVKDMTLHVIYNSFIG